MSWFDEVLRLPDHVVLSGREERLAALERHTQSVRDYAIQDGLIDPDNEECDCDECND